MVVAQRNGALSLALLGPPGAGKSTLACGLCSHLSLHRIAIGERLRELAKTDLTLCRTLSNGGFVSDEFAWDAIAVDIRQSIQDSRGFLLDGFPRTIGQVELLDQIGGLDRVFFLNVDEATAGIRIRQRSQSVDTRTDDLTAAAVQRRLQLYADETGPVIEAYQLAGILNVLDATRTPGQVLASALHVMF